MSSYQFTTYLPYQFYKLFPNHYQDRLRSHLSHDTEDEKAESLTFEYDLCDPDEESHPFAVRLIIPKELLSDDTPSHKPYWPAKEVAPTSDFHKLKVITEKGILHVPGFYDHAYKGFIRLEPISTMGERAEPVLDAYYCEYVERDKVPSDSNKTTSDWLSSQ